MILSSLLYRVFLALALFFCAGPPAAAAAAAASEESATGGVGIQPPHPIPSEVASAAAFVHAPDKDSHDGGGEAVGVHTGGLTAYLTEIATLTREAFNRYPETSLEERLDDAIVAYLGPQLQSNYRTLIINVLERRAMSLNAIALSNKTRTVRMRIDTIENFLGWKAAYLPQISGEVIDYENKVKETVKKIVSFDALAAAATPSPRLATNWKAQQAKPSLKINDEAGGGAAGAAGGAGASSEDASVSTGASAAAFVPAPVRGSGDVTAAEIRSRILEAIATEAAAGVALAGPPTTTAHQLDVRAALSNPRLKQFIDAPCTHPPVSLYNMNAFDEESLIKIDDRKAHGCEYFARVTVRRESPELRALETTTLRRFEIDENHIFYRAGPMGPLRRADCPDRLRIIAKNIATLFSSLPPTHTLPLWLMYWEKFSELDRLPPLDLTLDEKENFSERLSLVNQKIEELVGKVIPDPRPHVKGVSMLASRERIEAWLNDYIKGWLLSLARSPNAMHVAQKRLEVLCALSAIIKRSDFSASAAAFVPAPVEVSGGGVGATPKKKGAKLAVIPPFRGAGGGAAGGAGSSETPSQFQLLRANPRGPISLMYF